MQFSTVAAASALAATVAAGYSNATTVTTDVTVTGYTTYCPEPTVITITKCEEVCKPTEITVTEATTLTVTEPCVVPTTYTTAYHTTTSTVPCEECEHKPTTVAGESTKPAESTTAAVSSYEGAAAKNVAGAVAGVAAVAAALF
ncbi:hypothetical protein ACI3LY_005488 [Candidozyma auris]|nr:hypothetical protein B9J08_004577 [[Candida] auris]PIS50185.1 hypothetical protein CJI97_004875 [[Candida] auris]PSK74942.1 hypothetical protein CJJ07_005292 [[Candida] auris]QEL62416.1 hypothetical protein CJJ09_004592 [[Candida] auris]QRG39973.1 hypothetical protein FDK38_004434 [[Candida] auris]